MIGRICHKLLNLYLFLNDAFQNLFCRFVQEIWCVWAALIGDNGDAQFVLRINEQPILGATRPSVMVVRGAIFVIPHPPEIGDF